MAWEVPIVTSAFSPASDRQRAAEFLLPLLDDGVDTDASSRTAMAVLARAEATAQHDGRNELISGLAATAIQALMLAHGGPAGAREQLQLVLLDPEVTG
jgi:hypothetical protein